MTEPNSSYIPMQEQSATVSQLARPVALFDLNNTLVSMPHLAYVKSINPRLAEQWEQGNLLFAQEYEECLARGLQEGAVAVTVLPGVEDKLEELCASGLENAVFSTYTGEGILAALEQVDLPIARVYSTWDLQNINATKKSISGFERLDVWVKKIGRRIVLYADDQEEPLIAAHNYFTRDHERAVALYLVGTDSKKTDCQKEIIRIPSISDIVIPKRIQ